MTVLKTKVKDSRPLRQQFRCLEELIRHFEKRLSILEIETVIRDTGQLFICRGAVTDEQERLTFIGRCHHALQGSFLLRKEAMIGDLPKAMA